MSQLPEGFVYLDEINPNISVDLRYFTNINFTASVVNGYKANRSIMTKPAALALNEAWKVFDSDGFNIVVYDSYRPQKAVDQFVSWAEDVNADQSMKSYFFPYVKHSEVFDKGYVAKRSGHTRGSTIDMSIISKGEKLKPIVGKIRTLSDGRNVTYLDDNSVDMGTSFDLLDPASSGDSQLVDADAQKRRRYFINTMVNAGFSNYEKEWWHFTLKCEPFTDKYFDFDVE